MNKINKIEKRYDGLYVNAFVLKEYDKGLIESYFYEIYRQTKDECESITEFVLKRKYKNKIIEHLGVYDSFLDDMCDRFLAHGYRLVLNEETGFLEWLRLR